MENRSVALDGPSAAGKSTLARRAAKNFGYIYVDTGALYRCIGLYTLRNNVGSKDEQGVVRLLSGINLEIVYDETMEQRMILNAEDVTDLIRTPEASMYASDISAMPPVRAYLLSMQRERAVKNNVVMDGRDIGTVVLPDAGLKVFITASPEVRVQRRYLELIARNIDTTLEDVEYDLITRDKNDSERQAAPLRVADDAVVLDTTDMDLDESFVALCDLITGRFGK